MKKTYACASAALIAAAILVSCATAPAVKEEPVQADRNSSVSTVPEGTAAEAASGGANEQTPDAETALTDPGESGVSVAEQAPLAPAGDRIIRFYPEPETGLAVPDPVPATTQPVVTPPKTVPPAKSASTAPKSAPVPETKAAEPATEADEPVEKDVPGIWVEEPVAPSVPSAAAVPANPPSRTASVAVGQSLEVWYPGTGWVYLGDGSSRNGLAYETRRLDKNDTLFAFKALKEGDYILNFSRFDVLEDDFSADSLAVSVLPASTASGRKTDKIRAPDYRSVTASAVSGDSSAVIPASSVMTDEPSLFGTAPASLAGAATPAAVVSQGAAGSASTAVDPAAILEKAKKALAAGDPASALALLDSFFSAAVTALDEGWYLRAQAYEANSAVRDIRKALDCYKTLVSAYPDSVLWKDADARIRYIQQYYLRIR